MLASNDSTLSPTVTLFSVRRILFSPFFTYSAPSESGLADLR